MQGCLGSDPRNAPPEHCHVGQLVALLGRRLVLERGSEGSDLLEPPIADARLQFVRECLLVAGERNSTDGALACKWSKLSTEDNLDLIRIVYKETDDERVVSLTTFALEPRAAVTSSNPPSDSPSLTSILKERPKRNASRFPGSSSTWRWTWTSLPARSPSSSKTSSPTFTRSVHWGPTVVIKIEDWSPRTPPLWVNASNTRLNLDSQRKTQGCRDRVRMSL